MAKIDYMIDCIHLHACRQAAQFMQEAPNNSVKIHCNDKCPLYENAMAFLARNAYGNIISNGQIVFDGKPIVIDGKTFTPEKGTSPFYNAMKDCIVNGGSVCGEWRVK